MNRAGKRRFMASILARADEVLPRKPLTMVLVPRRVPTKVKKAMDELERTVGKLYEKIRTRELQKYDNMEIPFGEVSVQRFERKIERAINRKGKSAKVVRILWKLAKELR
ncbi:hypothetical protein ES703_10066 [subsurface metagenome]